MKYLAMIQARCGSTRLPNKVLMDLAGKPALQRMIERVQKSKYLDEVIVITSIEKSNFPILKLCVEMGVRIGIGSEDDVLDRFYQTARLLSPEYVIRLTADCPCFDSELLDDAIEKLDLSSDYCYMLSETLADGLDFEIIKFDALKKAWKESSMTHQREHVTAYITENKEIFRLQDYVSPIGYFGQHRWTIDEIEDYELVKKIYQHFVLEEKTEDFGYREILQFLEDNSQLQLINNMYRRNEGYEKSLKEDRLIIPE